MLYLLLEPNSFFGNFESIRRHLAASTTVLLKRSATPFCSGVSGTVNSRAIYLLMQKFLKALFLYSVSLSVLKFFGRPYCATYSLKVCNACILYFINFTTV